MNKYLINDVNRYCYINILKVAIPRLEKEVRTNKYVIQGRAVKKFIGKLKKKRESLSWWKVISKMRLDSKADSARHKYWWSLTYKEVAQNWLYPAQRLLDALQSPCFIQTEIDEDLNAKIHRIVEKGIE